MTCDCGTDNPRIHLPGCIRYSLPVDSDVAAQVAAEDGFPVGARQIRHPAFAKTRRYLKVHPLPTQQDRRAS
ncbi:hypothetical protein BG418_18125 [Streptomyces sp. CBMA152]|nr:hypothetical protein [Streptomyces sp. CBMA152]